MRCFAFKVDTGELYHRIKRGFADDLMKDIKELRCVGVWRDPYLQYEAFLFELKEDMMTAYHCAVGHGFATAAIIRREIILNERGNIVDSSDWTQASKPE